MLSFYVHKFELIRCTVRYTCVVILLGHNTDWLANDKFKLYYNFSVCLCLFF